MMERWNRYFLVLPEEFKTLFKNACKLEKYVTTYLDNDNSLERNELDFQTLLNFIKENNIDTDTHNLCILLRFLSILTAKNFINNYDYFPKIQNIILFFKKEICSKISPGILYEYFGKSNYMLLFLYQNEILDIFDSQIINKIFTSDNTEMIQFFYPEIRKRVLEGSDEERNKEAYKGLKKILNFPYLSNLKLIDKSFEEDRARAENDDILAEMIRKDEFSDFIRFKEKNNLNINASIHGSIFDGNIFLSNNHLSLIEYSAFFGSIQIFKYLYTSKAEVSSVLWNCAIYGQNYEIIHILEDNSELQSFYEKCFQVSIKLHFNDLANYFLESHLDGVISDESFNKCISSFNFRFIKRFLMNVSSEKNNRDEEEEEESKEIDLDDYKSFLNNIFHSLCINNYYYMASCLSKIQNPVQIDVNMKLEIFI